MTFMTQFMKKSLEWMHLTKCEEPCKECESPQGFVVERFKDGEWKKFGKVYSKQEYAINALIDWQALFQGVQFRVGEIHGN